MMRSKVLIFRVNNSSLLSVFVHLVMQGPLVLEVHVQSLQGMWCGGGEGGGAGGGWGGSREIMLH